MKVSIRPLKLSDAKTSYQWRNNPVIWRLTGSHPTCTVTPEIELEWIKDVIARLNERRFAICLGDEKKYVGNVQLTNITLQDAEFHIFIGDIAIYGQGVGTIATSLILSYASKNLRLKEVYLYVHPDNLSAIRVYEKCGFIFSPSDDTVRLKYMYKL